MCKSDALIGLSSTRTSASPGAKVGGGISSSFNTLFGSPVSRKINAFINTSWVFRRRLIPPDVLRLRQHRSVIARRTGNRYILALGWSCLQPPAPSEPSLDVLFLGST